MPASGSVPSNARPTKLQPSPRVSALDARKKILQNLFANPLGFANLSPLSNAKINRTQ